MSAQREQLTSVDRDALVSELRHLRWALAVIAGLVGALAVHVIFCQTFLPDLIQGNGTSNTALLKGLTALSDSVGALCFLVLAAPTLRIGLGLGG